MRWLSSSTKRRGRHALPTSRLVPGPVTLQNALEQQQETNPSLFWSYQFCLFLKFGKTKLFYWLGSKPHIWQNMQADGSKKWIRE